MQKLPLLMHEAIACKLRKQAFWEQGSLLCTTRLIEYQLHSRFLSWLPELHAARISP